MGANDTLRPRQRRAIETLVTIGNVTEAAKTAGVTRKTIYRWLKQPIFQEALAEAEAESLAELSRQLGRLDAESIEALKKAIGDNEVGLALRASDVHLKHRARLRELLVGIKSDVTLGLDESTRQLLGKIIALAAACITEPDKLEKFRHELGEMAEDENA